MLDTFMATKRVSYPLHIPANPWAMPLRTKQSDTLVRSRDVEGSTVHDGGDASQRRGVQVDYSYLHVKFLI